MDRARSPAGMDREAVDNLLEALRKSLGSDMKLALIQAKHLQNLLAGSDLADAAAALNREIFDFETDSALRRLGEMAAQV